MSEVSFFPTYTTQENRVTNYVLLVMKTIYNENPKLLQNLFDSLFGEDKITVLPEFTQQIAMKTSAGGKTIPDGSIHQQAFKLIIEAKISDDFDLAQLESHLDAMQISQRGENEFLIMLGRFESDVEQASDAIKKKLIDAGDNVMAISYAQLIASLKDVETEGRNLSTTLSAMISELESYLDKENLLPDWETRLDVVNCTNSADFIEKYNIYECPAQAGAYNHKRAMYFGVYKNKKVSKIAEILAVVDVNLDWSTENVIINHGSKDELVAMAVSKLQTAVNDGKEFAEPKRVFVLGELVDMDFEKDTAGGLQGSKIYFDLKNRIEQIPDTHALAEHLNGKKWSDIR